MSVTAQLEQVGVALLPDADPGSRRHGYPWRPLAWQLIFVICRFAGLFCCVQAFRLEGATPGAWLASFALAYAIGLVVPGAPGGLGIFETTLLMRLGTAVPDAGLLAVVLSYRLVSTLADVVAAAALQADQWISGRRGLKV